ncbi:ABC transporter permease [soil metagenome]
MTRYILRRLCQAVPTLLGISILSFFLAHWAPGDPITFMTFDPKIQPEARETLRRQLGLDQPLPIQYISWLAGVTIRRGDQVTKLAAASIRCHYSQFMDLTFCDRGGGIIRGNLGVSLQTKETVWHAISERMPATLELGITSLLLALALGIPLGLLSAVYRGSLFDNLVRFFTVVGQAVPDFWMSLILIYFLSVVLGLFPTGGRCTVSLRGQCGWLDWLHHLVLPAFILSFGGIAIFSRLLRTETLEVIHMDYMRTARAKGLTANQIWLGHALRNALMPLLTVIGPAILGVLGGAVVVETVFAWPGLGRLTLDAIFRQDYPLVLGATMFFALLVILGNLLSDILYALADPRVRLR